MIKYLLKLKKAFPFLWVLIENANGVLFRFIYYKKILRCSKVILKDYSHEKFTYRFLLNSDLIALTLLFQRQSAEQFKYFKPHPFDYGTLRRLYNNPSFLMFGVFNDDVLVGYFFLRCFVNKKSFTGRFVDSAYQGHGISRRMGKILHQIAWNSKFRVFGTASRDNIKSINSYQSINNFKVIKELDNNFIFFEYLKSEEKPL